MGVDADIWNALKTRANAVPLTPKPPISWPDLAFTKPAGDYLEVHHVPNTNQRLFIGSADPHQYRGVLQISVFKPKGGGSNAGIAAGEAVKGHFPCDLELLSGSTRVRITKAPDIAQAIATDTHWMIPVTIQYEAFA